MQTLDGHMHNVSAVVFHPRLPLIISASEDGTVRLWHSTTYRPETTLNYGLERAWSIAVTRDANKARISKYPDLYIPHCFIFLFRWPLDTTKAPSC